MGKCAPLITAGSWFESTLSNQSRRPDGSRASRYERERRWFDSNRRGQISRPPDPRHCSSEGRMRVFDSLSRCHSCRSSSGSGARLWYGRWRGATPRTGTVSPDRPRQRGGWLVSSAAERKSLVGLRFAPQALAAERRIRIPEVVCAIQTWGSISLL